MKTIFRLACVLSVLAVSSNDSSAQGQVGAEAAQGPPTLTIRSPAPKAVQSVGALRLGQRVPLTVVGSIRVHTAVASLQGNKPTVTVNGTAAGLENDARCPRFQCWDFTAHVLLDRGGTQHITATGTDVLKRSASVEVDATVDFCRIGTYNRKESTPGKDPGVFALGSKLQGNRCHEIDGCSAPGISQKCADDPMSCKGGETVIHDPLLALPAQYAAAPTAFGRGTTPPTEFFFHGQRSRYNVPCNNHDLCYQTCLAPGADLEQAWHACNTQQHNEMLAVCARAYPEKCPFSEKAKCHRWEREKHACATLAFAYRAGVATPAGKKRFEQRQKDYCAQK